MTKEELDLILQLSVEKQVELLSKSSFSIPKWEHLRKQYDPNEHAIKTNLLKYPIIYNAETHQDDQKRITRALQKLAVNRMSQSMFATPVKRIYSYDNDSDIEQKAVNVIEDVYRIQNNIDSENIERCKQNNAACQIATIWTAIEEPSKTKGLSSKLSLISTTYSEKNGYKLYPIIDNNRNLLVISIEYIDVDNKRNILTYTNGNQKLLRHYKLEKEWVIIEQKKLEVFPVVYTHIDEPVWGGDTGTTQVEEIEELLSYQGMYTKAVAAPTFVLDNGETTGMNPTTDPKTGQRIKESQKDKKKIIKVGQKGSIKTVTWDGAKDSVVAQEERLINAFFEDNQIPNISFANLLNSRTSADNKDIMLTDAKGKAIDLGGEWVKLLNTELNKVVIPFLKIIYPSISEALDNISVRSVVNVYTIKNNKQNAEIVSIAGDSMSLDTKVSLLDYTDDVDAEVVKIQDERGAEANQL